MLIALLAGCGGSSDSGTDIDTIPVPEVELELPEAPEPPVPVYRPLDHDLQDMQQALEFMNSSVFADEYAKGVIPLIAEQSVEYAQRLLMNRHRHFVIVDKRSMNVILYNRFGVEMERYRMCCSRNYGTKHARRDNRTPEGFFSAGLTYDSTDWLYTDDDGHTSQVKGQFGPRFIRITNPVTTQVGIHGTCAPWSLGRRSSHGCIRIHNDNILKLVEYVTQGMPIIINPSDKDQQVNREEGYEVVQLTLKKSHGNKAPASTPQKSSPDSLKSTGHRSDTVPECETPPPLEPSPRDSSSIDLTIIPPQQY